MESYTNPIFVLIVLIGYIVLRAIYKPAMGSGKTISKTNKRLGYLLIVLLCVFSVQDSDYFHYKDYILSLSNGWEVSSLEDVYTWLASAVSYNYTLFRLCVWGVAFLLFIKAADRLNCNKGLVLLFFVSMYLTKFSYSRASLAMSIGLYGFTLIIRPFQHKFSSYVLGVLLVLSSFFFHKSAIVFIPLYFLSLLPFGKKSYLLFIIILPVIYQLLFTTGLSYLFSMEDVNMLDSETAISYLNQDKNVVGLGALVQRVLERTPYYFILLVLIFDVISNRQEGRSYEIRCIINFAVMVIVLSSLFLFDFQGNKNSGINTSVIYYRFLYYSILPLSIILSKLFEGGSYVRLLKIIQIVGYISVLYAILYSAYNMYLLNI